MDKPIEMVWANITTIIDKIKEKKDQDKLNFQLGCLGYRDISEEDDNKQFEFEPFSPDLDDMVKKMQKLKCFGGGDFTEDIN